MNQPLVGVGVVVHRDGKILLGRRRASHGAGCWSLPGGHLEFGETPQACAYREVLEETGLRLSFVQDGPWVNSVFEHEQKHYITIFMLADAPDGEPQRREPDKCDGWQWFAPGDLPTPLFLPLTQLIEQRGTDWLQRHSLRNEA